MKPGGGSRQVCWPSGVSVSSAGERVGQHPRLSDCVPQSPISLKCLGAAGRAEWPAGLCMGTSGLGLGCVV